MPCGSGQAATQCAVQGTSVALTRQLPCLTGCYTGRSAGHIGCLDTSVALFLSLTTWVALAITAYQGMPCGAAPTLTLLRRRRRWMRHCVTGVVHQLLDQLNPRDPLACLVAVQLLQVRADRAHCVASQLERVNRLAQGVCACVRALRLVCHLHMVLSSLPHLQHLCL